MFSGKPSIADLTESELILRVREWLGRVNPKAPEGIGDDCAVHFRGEVGCQLLTSDALIYGRHFDDRISARQAGVKLVNRNLSDIAAMGGIPDRALLNLMMGPNLALPWLGEFIGGLKDAALVNHLLIVGGDLSRIAPNTFIATLSVLGSSEKPVTRRSTRPGDLIFVTGELGGSIQGKHATFSPRLEEGRWLARQAGCTAMMDITDGLAKDLPSLLADGQSAQIDLSAIPIAKAAITESNHSKRPAIEHAFCDGEDYELLFTMDAETNRFEFHALWHTNFPDLPLTLIGEVSLFRQTSRLIDVANGSPLAFTQGFEHFKGK